jgi:hypothetical protein
MRIKKEKDSRVAVGGYLLPLTIRPIVTWPGVATQARKNAQFRSSYQQTSEAFAYEMFKYKASNIVLEMYVTEREIRNNGWLRSEATPSHPGVIVSFTSTIAGGAVRFPCDTFLDWRDNLRAIALSLEMLRRLDRYGVTKRAEQFAGWKALPSHTEPTLSQEAAAKIIEENTFGYLWDLILSEPDYAKRAVRAAVNATHPDKNNGDRTEYDRVERAKRVLTVHHGLQL